MFRYSTTVDAAEIRLHAALVPRFCNARPFLVTSHSVPVIQATPRVG